MLESLAAWRPQALSLLRIITGLLLIQHGMAKIIGFPAVAMFATLKPFTQIWFAGILELVLGAPPHLVHLVHEQHAETSRMQAQHLDSDAENLVSSQG